MAEQRGAAWYRIAALTAQTEAALELLTWVHRCKPYGSAPPHQYYRQFNAYAAREALLAMRRMWPQVRTAASILLPHYWRLRYQLGRIATAPDDKRSEIVCGPDLRGARNRWAWATAYRLADDGAPFEWRRFEQLAALSRIRVAMAVGYSTTCYNVSRPYDPLTIHPAQRIVLEYALDNAAAAFRSARAPLPSPPGALFLWRGVNRTLQDWRTAIAQSEADGRRRQACGSALWNFAGGAYYSWLYDYAGDAHAPALDLLLQWTQLEAAMSTACGGEDSAPLALALPTAFSALSARHDRVRLPREFEQRRDDIAADVEAWLPAADALRASEFGELGCPSAELAAVSALLDALARSLPQLPAGGGAAAATD